MMCHPTDFLDCSISQSDSSNPHQSTISKVSRVMKPSKAESAALGKLFPTSSSFSKLSSGFDPGSDLVFAAQKRRKKAARVKPSMLNLALLSVGTTSIPRGKHRKDLLARDQVRKVEFTREMSVQVVRNKIISTFSGQNPFTGYHLLSQGQDGRLTVSDNQCPTGEQFVEEALKHRGNVYLMPRKLQKVSMGCMMFMLTTFTFCTPLCRWQWRLNRTLLLIQTYLEFLLRKYA